VEVLGTLVNASLDGTAGLVNGTAGLVRAQHTGWTSVFSTSPGLPVQLWRALAVSAGVHMFLVSGLQV
jgi:hypothetical protein